MTTFVIDGFIRDIQHQIHSYIVPISINKLIAAFFDPVKFIKRILSNQYRKNIKLCVTYYTLYSGSNYWKK